MESVLTVVVSGPQATGKTTLALALGTAMGIPVFSRDPLMQALHRAGRPWPRRRGRWVAAAGLRLQTALLARQLELGQSAILECIAPPATRREWRDPPVGTGTGFAVTSSEGEPPGRHRVEAEVRPVERRARKLAARTPSRALEAQAVPSDPARSGVAQSAERAAVNRRVESSSLSPRAVNDEFSVTERSPKPKASALPGTMRQEDRRDRNPAG
jgi:hypothetical protein